MVGIIETLSSLERQPVDSQVEEKVSTYYLINTDNMTELALHGANDSKIHYKFNVYSDRLPEFYFTVTDPIANILFAVDKAPASPKVSLDVFEDSHGNSVQSFNQVTGLTPVTWNFNVKEVVWAEGNLPSYKAPYSRIWICKGGHTVVPYIVNHSLLDIYWLIQYGNQF